MSSCTVTLSYDLSLETTSGHADVLYNTQSWSTVVTNRNPALINAMWPSLLIELKCLQKGGRISAVLRSNKEWKKVEKLFYKKKKKAWKSFTIHSVLAIESGNKGKYGN